MKYYVWRQSAGYFRVCAVSAIALCLAQFGSSALGEAATTDTDKLYELSLEQAISTQIVSASRQSQEFSQLTAPVTVITADDIHYSGLTTIPEVLQYALGVDVFATDRNRYAVGVRGLHDFTSDRVLILIDGRRAESPFFGGSEFYRCPIMMEDIARIEIVRGPGGAAWGANAFNGVINIITKKPADVQGAFLSTTVSEFGDTYTHLRWAELKSRWQYRISVGYVDRKSSDDAGAGDYTSFSPLLNDLIGFSSYTADDIGRALRFDGEALYLYSDQTQLSFGLGYSHDQIGSFELGGYNPRETGWLETGSPFVRVEHDFENGLTGSLQWYGNFANSWIPSLFKWRTYENDLEGQLNFEPADGHRVSVGGNIHLIRVNSTSRKPQELVLPNEPYDERFVGLFAIDRWEVSDRLTLEAQLRGDYYSETQTDWSSRLSALVPVDEAKDHMLRFSAAKAFRAPLTAIRQITTNRIDVDPLDVIIPGPGPYAFNIVPNDDLNNEEIYSLEVGYTGQIADDLRVAANTYYQTYTHLIGYQELSNPFGATYMPDNIDGATAYGAEFEVTKAYRNAHLSAWYAYNYFGQDKSIQNVRSYAPPRNSVGLSSRLFLSDGFVFNTNYRFASVTPAPGVMITPDVDESHRLDLTLSKKILDGDGEVMVGLADVLNNTNGPNGAMGQLTAFETPGRMLFARLQLKY